MGQITITGTAVHGSRSLTTSHVIDAESVTDGQFTATNTYQQLLVGQSGEAQVVVIANNGDVDVSVQLQYGQLPSYAAFTVIPGGVIVIPSSIFDSAVDSQIVPWGALNIKAATGSAAINYLVIR